MHIVNDVKLREPDESIEANLPRLYVDKLPLNSNDIMSKEEFRKWSHLRHFIDEIPDVDSSIPVGLLIGNNVPRLMEPYEVIRAPCESAPYAIRYLLGWSRAGPMKNSNEKLSIYRTNVVAVSPTGTLMVECSRDKSEERQLDVVDFFDKKYKEDFQKRCIKRISLKIV